MVLNYIYSSNRGLKRNYNEDFAGVFEMEEGMLSIVCDGLGGNNAGDVASEIAVNTISDYFANHSEEEHPERMHNAIDAANKRIVELSGSDDTLTGMATTVVTLLISGQKAYWGHVGDSRLYYFDGNNLSQLTKDHSLVQRLVDEGIIDQEEAEFHPQKNVITKALGDASQVEFDISSMLLLNNEWKFLLCTDGLSNVIMFEELERLLRENDLSVIEDNFIPLVEERGAPDNFTFIIVSGKS
jgi:protein phosphatase